jgi:histidinol-phosphate/aromatic aminotransferase/cobyric acid decarboxylase-like protein
LVPGRQLGACEALNATDYYQAQWRATHPLREELQQDLEALGWEVIPGCANFLLCHLPGCVPSQWLSETIPRGEYYWQHHPPQHAGLV